MPELPEVERAAKLLRNKAIGKKIARVETTEGNDAIRRMLRRFDSDTDCKSELDVVDTIVFSGVTHLDFASEITGRTVTNASRYGKVFYLELDGAGRMPVLHFGMTGMLQVKGEEAIIYGDTLNKKPRSDWPPRFMKFILHLTNDDSEPTLIAFMDPRRLGRVRLCSSPIEEPPISELGFDPILSMPTLEDFQTKVTKRRCAIKHLLLDQSFSAGVGNWVADEVLYHARIHPEHRCNTLNSAQIAALHKEIQDVCKAAVAVDADADKFPTNWLFKHRWGKGKRGHSLTLPSGEPATIKFLTVGGRTAAYVEELQTLPVDKGLSISAKDDAEDVAESSLTELSDSEVDIAVQRLQKRKKLSKRSSGKRTKRKKT